jgi:hypothetical protein
MNISFPINILLDNGLSADDFVICTLLLEKKQLMLKRMYKITSIEDRIKRLINQGYLKFNGLGMIVPINEVEVTDKFRTLISAENPFEEFHSKFPVKVTRPDGKENYLKVDKARCRVKYKKLISKNTLLHKHIIRCLDREIDYRKKTSTMSYFKQMKNWLDGEEWKKFEEDYKEKKANDKNPIGTYGTNPIQ